jgi:hypothetical protein
MVEHRLRQDSAGAYARSTLATRDHYRHAVEQLARRSGVGELEIARRAVEHARAAAQTGNMRAAHIGYTLIDAGRAALEAEIGYHPRSVRLFSGLFSAIRLRGTWALWPWERPQWSPPGSGCWTRYHRM